MEINIERKRTDMYAFEVLVSESSLVPSAWERYALGYFDVSSGALYVIVPQETSPDYGVQVQCVYAPGQWLQVRRVEPTP